MQNTNYNSLHSLIFNTSFRKWVLGDEGADREYWDNWLLTNPAKAELVAEARNIIYALNINFQSLSPGEVDQAITAIVQQLATDEEENNTAETVSYIQYNTGRKRVLWWAAAATVAVITVALLFAPGKKNDPLAAFIAAKGEGAYITLYNRGAADTTITLPDNSSVTLVAGSNIVYAKDFTATYREVYLTGRGFFSVVKNSAHPFLVYTSSIITKVLGTSFWVTSYAADSNASVIVKTGKVTVFKRENFTDASATADAPGAKIITPNQTVIYSKNEINLLKTIVPKPVIIIPEPTKKELVFNATPVAEVFTKLQELYGISVIYNNGAVAHCSLSASLEDESFYDKLDIICKAINATYDVIDGSIVIYAKGCN